MLNTKFNLGNIELQNRVVIQPMEGCDCDADGSPSELTVKKYMSFARSGAAIIWFEASAVCPEGKTNSRQMYITEENLDKFANLLSEMREIAVKECGFSPLMILQLTHSGRQSMTPMIAYRNPLYEQTRPLSDENIVSDEYLDTLPDLFANKAALAVKAGFDAIDVKACHGYLMIELLSAFNRQGRYGGSFANRTACLLNCLRSVKKAVPENFPVVARIGMTDMVKKPYGFGTDENGDCNLTETKMLIRLLYENGVRLINVTLGNPYYNPHINRPFRKGSYIPPEKPEDGLKRFYEVEKELKRCFPDIVFVGSGLSYYRENLFVKAEDLLIGNVCDLVGFGRESLAYPEFYRDYLNGNFQYKKCCVSCSKCTLLMRNKQVAGCAVFNEYYRNLFKEKVQ